jgi:hypothetical protein
VPLAPVTVVAMGALVFAFSRVMVAPTIPPDVVLSVPLIVKVLLTVVEVTLAVALRVVVVGGTGVTFTVTSLLVAGRMDEVPA